MYKNSRRFPFAHQLVNPPPPPKIKPRLLQVAFFCFTTQIKPSVRGRRMDWLPCPALGAGGCARREPWRRSQNLTRMDWNNQRRSPNQTTSRWGLVNYFLMRDLEVSYRSWSAYWMCGRMTRKTTDIRGFFESWMWETLRRYYGIWWLEHNSEIILKQLRVPYQDDTAPQHLMTRFKQKQHHVTTTISPEWLCVFISTGKDF